MAVRITGRQAIRELVSVLPIKETAVYGVPENLWRTVLVVLVVAIAFAGLRAGLTVGATAPLAMPIPARIMRRTGIEPERMSPVSPMRDGYTPWHKIGLCLKPNGDALSTTSRVSNFTYRVLAGLINYRK